MRRPMPRSASSRRAEGFSVSSFARMRRFAFTTSARIRAARLVVVLLPSGEDELRFAAVAGDQAELAATTITRSTSKSGRVLERRRSERSDSVLDDPDVDHEAMRLIGARTGLWVPLLVRGRAIGVLAAHDKLGADARFTDTDLRLAETFATRAAVAV